MQLPNRPEKTPQEVQPGPCRPLAGPPVPALHLSFASRFVAMEKEKPLLRGWSDPSSAGRGAGEAMKIIFPDQAQERLRSAWSPHADVYQTRQGWVIKLDLAGVKPQDVSVQVRGSRVSISGVRKDWIVEKDWRHYSMEISYSRFERIIELPCELTRVEISNECRDGMLLIHLTAGEK